MAPEKGDTRKNGKLFFPGTQVEKVTVPIINTLIFSIILFIIFAASYDSLFAGTINLTIRFGTPSIVTTERGYTKVVFPQTKQAGRPGEPSFPFRAVQVLLPPGESVKSVKLIKSDLKIIGEEYRLYPYQLPSPGDIGNPSQIPGEKSPFIIKSDVYMSPKWIEPPFHLKTGYLRGHSIALGAITPVVYRPLSGTLGYYREMTLSIETETNIEAQRALKFLRNGKETIKRLKRLIENPELLEEYQYSISTDEECLDCYEYLIITRDSLKQPFEPLKDFYTRRGIRTRIVTVEEIDSSFTGVDLAEKVRNEIIEEYTNHHIDFVLLGGDGDGAPGSQMIVPYRGFYCGVQSSSFYQDKNIPSDLYFAALDGSWNTDADSLWGEPGEEDFYSEIGVGRACVDTKEEATTFVSKTINYQQYPVSQDERKASLFGEKLWSDPLTYGGDEMDQLVGTCTAYGFTTTGIPEDFDITKYYDRDLGYWDKSAVFDEINAGTNWVSHAGHSNWQYVMRLSTSDVTDDNFTNDGVSTNFPIIYSYGCYAGAFDNRTTGENDYLSSDCIAEQFITIHHGAIAFLGNSRYGWFTEGTTNGPSHHLQREFFDAIFTEGLTRLGEANQRSKDETVPFIDLPDEYEPGAQRWCYYTLNLLGDPALDGWTDTPTPISVTHEPAISRLDSLFYVETDAPYSIGSCFWGGTSYGVGTADSLGRIIIKLSTPTPDTLDSMELVITSHNRLEYTDTIPVVESTDTPVPAPPIVLRQNVPNPFNPSTTISFTINEKCHVKLSIFDVSGRLIATLIDEELVRGTYSKWWHPENLSSGVYFYRLQAGKTTITRKAVLIR